MIKSKTSKKKIFLSDILDSRYFDTLIGTNQYLIFDKDSVLEELKGEKLNRDVVDYIQGGLIEKALTKILRNKKIKNIVYLLYSTDPLVVKNNINTKIISKFNKNSSIEYNIITTKRDFQEFKYKGYTKSDFSNIYIREPKQSDQCSKSLDLQR